MPKDQGFQVYADADADFLAISWRNIPSLIWLLLSRSGWAIFYEHCWILWASKLQSQVAQSSTKAKCISPSTALQDVIPFMEHSFELNENDFDVLQDSPYVFSYAFEDNSNALVLTSIPKMWPCTKHINIGYHFFESMYGKEKSRYMPSVLKINLLTC